jgi:site-specific DNA-methyltransferase (adenine-specific)
MLLFLASKIDLGFSPDWYCAKAKEYKKKHATTFNLWQGGRSKSNVLEYAKDKDGYHPAQKPLLLLEDLIQTYSNEGDTVLDFTMGSGSTCVAAVNTNRHYIGFELDERYFDIARKRIEEAEQALKGGDTGA